MHYAAHLYSEYIYSNMPTVGEQLRAARLERNLTIDEIAKSTRIRPTFLEHLERGEYEHLPEPFFAVSFVRQFAEAVGLAPQALAATANSEMNRVEAPELTPAESVPSPETVRSWSNSGNRIRRILRQNAVSLLRGIVPVILIAGGIFFAYQSDRLSGERDPVVEASPQSIAAPPRSDSALPEAPGTGEQATPRSDPEVDRPGASTPSSDGSLPNTDTGVRLGTFALEVQATEVVWVQVVADDANDREMTLQPGESVSYHLGPRVHVALGNAGGANILIDGQDQGPLGESGQVRHFRITQEGLTPVSREDF